MIYVFEDYELDTQLYELRQAGQLRKLEPQVFNVLTYLLEHRDRVVTKQELLDSLWSDQFISEVTLNHRLMAARKAIGDSGRAQRCIKTLHGRGYRFIAAVDVRETQASLARVPPAAVAEDDVRMCAACQHNNQPSAQFCIACGTRLGRHCPRCQEEAPQAAAFCPACGQRLDNVVPDTPLPPSVSQPDVALPSRVSGEGERKQVTVLCCGIADTSAFAARLDPEEMHSLLHRFFALVVDEVQRYAGTITQYLHSGCIALFGVPVAHEDHARRAALAALALQQRLQREPAVLGHEDITVGMGVHTGMVIVGTIDDHGQTTYTTVGNTITRATQVQTAAPPGSVLLTAETARLVADDLSYEAFAPADNTDEPAAFVVYQLTGMRQARTRLGSGGVRGLARFVGRGRELELLRERLMLAKDGHGQAVSIIGEAGLGKSRLLYELRRMLAQEDVTFLEGRCSPYGAAEAYLPLIDLLKQRFDIDATDSGAVIRDKVMHVLHTLGADAVSTAPYVLHLLAAEQATTITAGLLPEVLKGRIFEALQLTLIQAAATRPLVIALEDVHVADPTSADFVTCLLERLAAVSVLLVCTYRPEFLSTWSRKSYHSAITLTPLSHQDSRQLLAALLGSDHVQDALVDLVVDKSDGVPFFLEELVRSLRETGEMVAHDGQWQLTATSTTPQVPATVQDVLMARIDRLPEGAKRLLQIGAVIGRAFPWTLLQAVADVEEHELRPLLTALIEAELLYEQGYPSHTTYVFKHALTQEVAYTSLLASVRRRWHQQIGEAILARHGDDIDEWSGVLARHFVQSGDTAQALPSLVHTGERALRVYANAEALHAFTQAVDILHGLPQTEATRHQRVDLTLRLASLHVLLGHYGESLPFFAEALDQARAAGDTQAVAHLETRIGRVRYNMGEYDAAVACLERALALAEQIQDTTRRAICFQSLGYVYFSSGRLAKAIECFRNALDLSEAADNVPGVVIASTYLSNAQARAGAVPDAVRWGRRALALSEELQNDRRIAWACIMLAQALNLSGDFAESSVLLERAVQLCERVGDFLGRAWVHIWSGEICAMRDRDYTAALEYANQVVDMGKASGGFQHEVAHQCVRGAEYLLRLGRSREAFDSCQAGLTLALETSNTLESGYAYMVLAELHASEAYEDWEQASWYLEESLKALRTVGAQVDVGRAHLAGGRIARRRHDGSARQWAESARDLLTACGATPLLHEAEAFLQSLP